MNRLYYRRTGSGPSFIILHGLYGSSDNWVGFAKKLAPYFKVVSIDQRNHGKSFHSEEFNFSVLGEDVNQFCKSHSISRPIILGHSMGGKVAMYYAAMHPDNIGALIVLDISPFAYKNEREFQSGKGMNHWDIINSLEALDIQHFNNRRDVDMELSKYIKSQVLRMFLLKNLKRNKLGQFYWALNLMAIKDNLPRVLEGLNPEFEINPSFPSLFIKAEKSNYIQQKDFDGIKKMFSNSEIITMSNVGHWLHTEKSNEILNIIMNFLYEHGLVRS